MKKIWINRAENFKEAERFDADYYRNMTPEERIDAMELLRKEYWKLKKGGLNAHRQRLRRVVTIIK